jgi:epoxyqueuosine reductase
MADTQTYIVLHTCCAPCLTYVGQLLSLKYNVVVYFYNPNIYPPEEYERRKDELLNYGKKTGLNITVETPDFENWYKYIKGLENIPEGKERCFKCYEMRLKKTASFAKANGLSLFTTVLSISPHKNARKINEIGAKIAENTGLTFLEANFKKNGGFQKSCELSRQFDLYRQNYCGCEYSIKKDPPASL